MPNIHPIIKTCSSKKLVGKTLMTSLSHNKTGELWSSFMPRRKEIKNNVSSDLYSLQIYPPLYFQQFNPSTIFPKWALIEVTDFEAVPENMVTFELTESTYLTFTHCGDVAQFAKNLQYLFQEWMPQNGYTLDDSRPHFEILGEKYKHGAPDSEEEVWIPIKTSN